MNGNNLPLVEIDHMPIVGKEYGHRRHDLNDASKCWVKVVICARVYPSIRIVEMVDTDTGEISKTRYAIVGGHHVM